MANGLPVVTIEWQFSNPDLIQLGALRANHHFIS